jgi:hypothetical protein
MRLLAIAALLAALATPVLAGPCSAPPPEPKTSMLPAPQPA